MADEPNKDGKTSELDIIEGRAENLGDPVEVHLDDGAAGKGEKGAADAGAKRPVEADGDKGDGKGEKPKPKPDEDMESLRRQVQAERQRREAAEARDRESKERIQRFENESQTHEANLIDSNLRAAEHEKTLAKRAYVEATGSGDPEKVADAIDKLTSASARVNLFNEAKSELERGRGRRPHEGAVTPREPERRAAPATDPVEAAVHGLPQRSADWVRAHPECVTDPAISANLNRAHYRALGEGHAAESPEYFASVENTLFPQRRADAPPAKEADPGDGQRRDPEPQRRQASAAAPVRGGGTSNGNGNGSRRTVTLSPEQRAMADSMDISYQDYARNLVALESEGRIKRSVN